MMAGKSGKTVYLGAFGVFLMAGFAAQEPQTAYPYRTGLIPHDAGRVQEIVEGWPRITRVNLNWLGFERVNQVKAAKGKAPLEPLTVRPIGREVESSVAGRAASIQSVLMNPDILGDLPGFVDNSKLKFFPPIRDQAALGSCVAFATTYTQLSHMAAFQRDLDIRDPDDNANKFSPKWTYNFINGGKDSGAYLSEAYTLLEGHGACTWAEFPYDDDYLAWCLKTPAWRRALESKVNPTAYLDDVSQETHELAKALLTDGYVLVFGTFFESWMTKAITDDPLTSEDDAEVGKTIGYWLRGHVGAHSMTIVGYNDAIWTDINGNGVVDTGEKGAFRVANSWGTEWGDQGFIWLAYDALMSSSAVPFGPSVNRFQALNDDMAFVLTVRDSYAPLMTADFTINLARRNQLKLTLGHSETSAPRPTTTWTPPAFKNRGGSWAFDGSLTAVDGTFVLDFSDILVEGGGLLRYYLGLIDGTPGDPTTLSAFKIVDLTTAPPTEVPSALVPQLADGGDEVYSYVDYAYAGPSYNDPPTLQNPRFSPDAGTYERTFTFSVDYYDEDGDAPSVANVFIDGNPKTMVFSEGASASKGRYVCNTELAVGSHEFYFYFEDDRGGPARAPLAGAISGPEVYTFLLTGLQPWSVPVGGPAFMMSVLGNDFVDGAVVKWDGSDRPTTFVDATRLDAAISAGDIALGRSVGVSVRNPDGGFSNPRNFFVLNPYPLVTAISPSQLNAGTPHRTLTLLGSGFVPGAIAVWGGAEKPTTYVSGTEIRAELSAQDVAIGGRFEIRVSNPPPGGGWSYPSAYIQVADFVLQSGGAATVVAGQSTTSRFSVESRFGQFDAPVTLSSSDAPRGCTVTFSPETLTAVHTYESVYLTITTTARSPGGTVANSGPAALMTPAFGLLLLVLVHLPRLFSGKLAPRRRALRWMEAVALVCLMVGVSGCSSGGGDNPPDTGTPAGTYYLSIRAVSGEYSAAASFKLVVK